MRVDSSSLVGGGRSWRIRFGAKGLSVSFGEVEADQGRGRDEEEVAGRERVGTGGIASSGDVGPAFAESEVEEGDLEGLTFEGSERICRAEVEGEIASWTGGEGAEVLTGKDCVRVSRVK